MPEDDPGIAARMKAHREAQRKASIEGMTVAERLMRASALRTATIAIPDDTPEGVQVEVYVPTRAELDRISALIAGLRQAAVRGDTAAVERQTDEIYQTYAGLCVDPALDVEFWRSGNFGLLEYTAIQDGLFELVVPLREEARRFRAKSYR